MNSEFAELRNNALVGNSFTYKAQKEIRSTKQIRMTKIQMIQTRGFFPTLEIISSEF